jgi:hypothetical protein
VTALEPLPLQTIEPGQHCTVMVALPGHPPFSMTARYGDTERLRDLLIGNARDKATFAAVVSVTGEMLFVPLDQHPLVLIHPVRAGPSILKPGQM